MQGQRNKLHKMFCPISSISSSIDPLATQQVGSARCPSDVEQREGLKSTSLSEVAKGPHPHPSFSSIILKLCYRIARIDVTGFEASISKQSAFSVILNVYSLKLLTTMLGCLGTKGHIGKLPLH